MYFIYKKITKENHDNQRLLKGEIVDPIYLQALMRNEITLKKKSDPEKTTTPKTDLEKQLEKQIDKSADALVADEGFNSIQLMTPEVKRSKKKLEIKEVLEFSDLQKQMEVAITILLSEGASYLGDEAHQALVRDLSNVLANVSSAIEDPANLDVEEKIKISDTSVQSIADVATKKFDEGSFTECLALFSLLTLLKPNVSEFWFRYGITAQITGNYVLAASAYTVASELNPEFFASHLFAAECYARSHQLELAKVELNAAKMIANSTEVDSELLDLQTKIQEIIDQSS